MIPLVLIAELLISSFFLSTLANFILTKLVFNQDFAKIQNWLGIILSIGLGLYYFAVYLHYFPINPNILDVLPFGGLNEDL